MLAANKPPGRGVSIWGHNGKWTATSPYRDAYDFASGGPPQGSALWDHLFGGATSAGMRVIKQDHMGEQIGTGSDNWKNTSILKSWLAGMGEGASRSDVGVLYCCAPPNAHMTGASVPAAFGVRASPDYVWQASGRVLKLPTVQWAVGPDNAFHWNGIGLLPYKDTFFSNSSASQLAGDGHPSIKQWPPFQSYHERNAPTHALMALLTMAQVTFADRVASANRTLLMMLIREDGASAAWRSAPFIARTERAAPRRAPHADGARSPAAGPLRPRAHPSLPPRPSPPPQAFSSKRIARRRRLTSSSSSRCSAARCGRAKMGRPPRGQRPALADTASSASRRA
jgi:hypothetical protein